MTSRFTELHGRLRVLIAGLMFVAAGGTGPASEPSPTDWRSVIAHYATLVHANADDALTAARRMQSRIAEFSRDPSPATLDAARAAWLAARVPYLQLEATRFYDGAIERYESHLNAWPLDENYVDYVAGNRDAGVINQPGRHPVLTRELILALNEKEGKKNISTGFHAIEFLLWGQDTGPTGPGSRPHTDYLGAPHAERRREYLRLVTDLLVEQLAHLRDDWAPDRAGNYRAEFLALPPAEAVGKILKGLGTLSGPELGGERLTVSYETKEQEDEHSCFSDNTHNDVIYDAIGIQNLYLGRYTRTDGTTLTGPGVHDLLLDADPALAARLAAQIEAGIAAARAVPPPFDQAILGPDSSPGRKAVKAAIGAFWAQSNSIARAAAALGIRLKL